MTQERKRFFLVELEAFTVALPLEYVIEVMRALPTEPVSGMPPFVLGVSIIRGEPVPVVGLDLLLSGREGARAGRYVTVRVNDKSIALAVEEVTGVRELGGASLETMPSLLRQANPELIAAIGALDRRILILLDAARALPDSLRRQLLEREAAS